MFVVSFVIFATLGFYLDRVLPRTYGEKSPCCFCFTRKFWSSCCGGNQIEEDNFAEQLDADELKRRDTLRNTKGDSDGVTDPFELKYLQRENYEPVAPEIARMELENQFLKISDLKKTYPNGFKAVNGINLKMYNG